MFLYYLETFLKSNLKTYETHRVYVLVSHKFFKIWWNNCTVNAVETLLKFLQIFQYSTKIRQKPYQSNFD